MTFLNYTDEGYPGVQFGEVAMQLSNQLTAGLRLLGEQAIASQIPRVFVPAQKLEGDSASFSFLAFPLPRPTAAERQQMSMSDARMLELQVESAHVRISVDEFDQIAWLYISGCPEAYDSLVNALSSVKVNKN